MKSTFMRRASASVAALWRRRKRLRRSPTQAALVERHCRRSCFTILGAITQVHVDQGLVGHANLLAEILQVDEGGLVEPDRHLLLQTFGVRILPSLGTRGIVSKDQQVAFLDAFTAEGGE
jgi:hypothetical protein